MNIYYLNIRKKYFNATKCYQYLFPKTCFLLGDSKNLGQRTQVLKKKIGLNLGSTMIYYDSMIVKLLNPSISSTVK